MQIWAAPDARESRRHGGDHFLVVGLRDGLGNQIFQYASAMGIAAHLGADLFFDSSHLRADERWLPKLIGSNYREVEHAQLLRLGFVPRGSRAKDRVAREASCAAGSMRNGGSGR